MKLLKNAYFVEFIKNVLKALYSKYEPVHLTYTGVMSLGGLCKQNEGNLQRERARKKASYLLNYSFAPDITLRFILSMLKSMRQTLFSDDNKE